MEPGKEQSKANTYTDEIGEYICNKIADGIPLAEICREQGMPGRRTVYDWMDADEAFAARIARARDVGYDAIAEDALEIADDGSNDWMARTGNDGTESWQLNGEHVQRSKLRVETRLKLLAKWSPKKYGEKVEQSGTITNLNVNSEVTPEEARRIAEALNKDV